ncbi:TetR/AcrR family transcriptional regulator [Companilactobacillus pabuli]|uniref:TetR/AcrR family transcriptional regulator n=1 Tax=Companilactobacillus pabuli TaxID=2714036 RepID=A0A7L7KWC7_9LACO|nr:TetR/AcrR family transcriptional regulator C-terminal domain-containing protein [Companilactobacillus pabuli]AKP03864.1 hypothetical protein ABB45_09705 [Companilactobacillus farciminis]AKS52169.1 hypothetical protein ABB44_09725 [Companilactobacillus farciminis]MDG5113097.1 TetR/AcrR family transcriptional regulator C-terminal domain-containing protein [Companilactobacillus pabuli]QMT84080.1 TetR/AcrR family transcriptional regulator [Companilactobacillus pabuli]GAQ01986.1 hypothetical pro
MDRRTKKTQNAIKQAFLELLQQKPINKITISEITDKVDIGRGTFYIHYTDIFDLQNKIIAETISDLENIFDLNYPDSHEEDFHEIAIRLINYISKHKMIFKILYKNGDENKLAFLIKKIFTKKIMKQEQLEVKNIQDQIEVRFFIAGLTGVISDWVFDNIEVKDQELIEILTQLMHDY